MGPSRHSDMRWSWANCLDTMLSDRKATQRASLGDDMHTRIHAGLRVIRLRVEAVIALYPSSAHDTGFVRGSSRPPHPPRVAGCNRDAGRFLPLPLPAPS